jgi:heavy metal sensor kinase
MISLPLAHLPVRIRLAVWYAGTLFLVLLLFGMGTFYTMRASVAADYNRELRLRLEGIESFLEDPAPHTLAEIQHELSEDSELRPGGELLQVSDAQGRWIYQSDSIRRLHIPVLAASPAQPRLATINTLGFPVRLLSATDIVRGTQYHIQIGQSLEQSSKLIRRFGLVLLGASPLLLVAAAGAGYWMAKRALRPIIQITADARAITAFDISHRIKLPRAKDELRDLSQTLNDMLARLESAFQRITQFTADASHELRTPVALIRTTAELALAEIPPKASREALLSILTESERTTDLLESLLTLARADANPRLPMEQVDCIPTVREAISRTSVLAAARGVHLAFSTELHVAEMLAHPGSLRRLFLILIDNGLKYTQTGGSVQVTLAEEDTAIVARIKDNGIGISPEDLPHIFERFYRADKSRDRSAGVGLGLAIAEWLAKAHGASIQVESVLEQGTLVTLRFPAVRVLKDSELAAVPAIPMS